MSDSKGAAIRQEIQHILGYCAYTPKGEVCQHIDVCSDDEAAELDAILAILAQEVKRVRIEDTKMWLKVADNSKEGVVPAIKIDLFLNELISK